MARYSQTFDFDANDPGMGGFFHQLFDSGKVMVGWGRSRTKWVQLDQAEIVNFLAAAHSMVVTDDITLKGKLADLAGYLVSSQPLTLERVSELAAADPAIGMQFAKILGGKAAGSTERALDLLRDELAEAGKL